MIYCIWSKEVGEIEILVINNKINDYEFILVVELVNIYVITVFWYCFKCNNYVYDYKCDNNLYNM